MAITRTAEKLLGIIADAAKAGKRMPTYGELRDLGIGDPDYAMTRLTRAGLVRREVYARNYRVIEIVDGEDAGLRTASAPEGHKPYRIIDKNGGRYVTRRAGGAVFGKRSYARADADERRDGPAPITLPTLKFMEGA